MLSALLCGSYMRFARARHFLDIPNERSSHSMPIPHSGGVALLSAFTLGLLFSAWFYSMWDVPTALLVGAALVLMFLGVIDDFFTLSIGLRVAIYSVVCVWLASTLLQSVDIGSDGIHLLLLSLTALAMLWFVNLYNFMDGIDGIATLQTILACCFAAVLSSIDGHNGGYVLLCLLLAAAHGGFLIWNFPSCPTIYGRCWQCAYGFFTGSNSASWRCARPTQPVLLGGVVGSIHHGCELDTSVALFYWPTLYTASSAARLPTIGATLGFPSSCQYIAVGYQCALVIAVGLFSTGLALL